MLPGVASRETVMYNHNSGFIADPHARTGVIEGNPIHDDMLYAARAARLDFIVNVVIDAAHDPILLLPVTAIWLTELDVNSWPPSVR